MTLERARRPSDAPTRRHRARAGRRPCAMTSRADKKTRVASLSHTYAMVTASCEADKGGNVVASRPPREAIARARVDRSIDPFRAKGRDSRKCEHAND